MKPQENELLLIYNARKKQDVKVLGYASAIQKYTVNERNIDKNPLTETQLTQVANKMGLQILDLIDKTSDAYLNEVKDQHFSNEEMLKIVRKNPDILKTPIVMLNGTVFFVHSAYDFINKGIEIEGITSKSGNSSEIPSRDEN
ncbi:arsenate reductase family protein [Roseivirga echinicomitans]